MGALPARGPLLRALQVAVLARACAEAELPECGAPPSRAATEPAAIQNMYPVPPPPPAGTVFEPHTVLPKLVHRLTHTNFTYPGGLATLQVDLRQQPRQHEPYLVDFFHRSGNTARLSQAEEATFYAAAGVLEGVCSLAVCDLSAAVKRSQNSRAFPGYPCLSGFSVRR